MTEYAPVGAIGGAARWLEVIADPVRLGILRTLSRLEEATAATLADHGQASHPTLRRHLEALVALGVIDEHPPRSDGETPGRPAARFSLPEEMRNSVRAVLGPADLQRPVAQAVGRERSRALAETRLSAAVGPMNGASAR